MRVGVRVTGDALISLLQDGRRLRASGGGTYTVDLGDSTSTVLTIRADEDDSLADGQTKTATVTIVDAGGADIGDRDTLTVTVRGSTAVPRSRWSDSCYLPCCSWPSAALPGSAVHNLGPRLHRSNKMRTVLDTTD